MNGDYEKLNKIKKDIIKHQNDFSFHPFTCGNNSIHLPLKPEMKLRGNDFELILICEDCNWQQDIPDFFINIR